MQKIKITQKEIDDLYQIEEITGETRVNPETQETQPEIPKEDTTPFLTEEEEKQDQLLAEELDWSPEENA